MKELYATVTGRGQVTIPAEVRRALGLGAGRKVRFRIDGKRVEILPAEFTLESAFGSVEPLARPEDFEEYGRLAWEERAQRAGGEMAEE